MDVSSVHWRKSSFGGGTATAALKVANHEGMLLVRDSKDADNGPVHRSSPAEWHAFIADVHNGEFDIDESGRLP